MSDRRLRPLGFLIVMLGLGLLLDTAWQGVGGLLLVGGTAMAGAGLWGLARRTRPRRAFVPERTEE